MLGRRFALISSIAAAIGLAGAGGFVQPAPMVTASAPRKANQGLFGGYAMTPPTRWGYGGPGTTMAQQKRASRKAKNVKRHRAACRG